MTISSEITRIKTNIASAYTALEEKGATIPEAQNSENLADTIGTITTGGSSGDGSYNTSSFSSQYPDLKSILANDTEDTSKYKLIFLFTANEDISVFRPGLFSGSVKLKTSDGVVYDTSNESGYLNHTWDKSKDIQVGDTCLKVRYAIFSYGFSSNITQSGSLTYLSNFLKNEYKTILGIVYNFDIKVEQLPVTLDMLEFIDFIENHGVIPCTFGASESVPTGIFYNNSNLTKCPYIDFSGCEKLPYSTLMGLKNAVTIPEVDIRNVTSGGEYAFRKLTSMVYAPIKLGAIDVNLSESPNLSKECLKFIADNAISVTGKTLTLGATNIARAGGADGEIITTLTNKGWTVN